MTEQYFWKQELCPKVRIEIEIIVSLGLIFRNEARSSKFMISVPQKENKLHFFSSKYVMGV